MTVIALKSVRDEIRDMREAGGAVGLWEAMCAASNECTEITFYDGEKYIFIPCEVD